ncbi:hypothetical protein MC7420_574 [Coleofasciculus chthonoplastes PCC 7420]|uniref:Uncharacterized protein n=1 Tax=Coleofasciculus chthonoplastes PCC 7420 TaxID=118168 RepID=B4VLT2_9CYAN|nr:hypothetical protein MC7420_574 [Coleofasciculus chthonoplastes PCC 7420]
MESRGVGAGFTDNVVAQTDNLTKPAPFFPLVSIPKTKSE